jgi:hypothetical protein
VSRKVVTPSLHAPGRRKFGLAQLRDCACPWQNVHRIWVTPACRNVGVAQLCVLVCLQVRKRQGIHPGRATRGRLCFFPCAFTLSPFPVLLLPRRRHNELLWCNSLEEIKNGVVSGNSVSRKNVSPIPARGPQNIWIGASSGLILSLAERAPDSGDAGLQECRFGATLHFFVSGANVTLKQRSHACHARYTFLQLHELQKKEKKSRKSNKAGRPGVT